MYNKHRVTLPLLLILILLVTACSTKVDHKSSPSNDEATQVNVVDRPKMQEDVDWDNMEAEITVYGVMYRGEWEVRYAQMLEQKFPNYKFNLITSTTTDEYQGMSVEELIASGTKIDIYTTHLGALQSTYMPVNLHTPMNELMDKHGIDVDAFDPQYFDAVTGDHGEIYALPVNNDGYVMYVNNALFDRFGLPHPTDGMSWDEAIQLADQFTRNVDGKQYVGLWYSPTQFMRGNQKSLGVADPQTNEPTLDTPEWNDWVTKMFSDPMQNPGLQDRAKETYFGHDDYRNADVLGMYVFTTGWLREPQFMPPDWDVVAMPTFAGDGIGAQPYANNFALASTSENPDAAMRVIKYLTSEEFQTFFSRQGFITPLKSEKVRDVLFDDLEGLDGINIEAVFYNELAPQRPLTPFDGLIIDDLHENILPDIVRGNTDVNTGLNQAQDNAKRIIEQELLRQQTRN